MALARPDLIRPDLTRPDLTRRDIGFCRDCDTSCGADDDTCRACGGPRLLRHPELGRLAIAHVDCDAFFASIEKRDRPELIGRPVVVGGGVRGVVTAACYVARLRGVRSAMPMVRALKACPDAVVIRPDFAKYVAAGRAVRRLMTALTPLVQPLSIDEAALDLSGTEALHGASPALTLNRLARRIEAEIGITVSIGLARNRLRAKIAAGRDKPRGFCVLGEEAAALLSGEPVRLLPGVGPALARTLDRNGLRTLCDLQRLDATEARRLLGDDGAGLVARARLLDARAVDPRREAKSVGAETTFDADLTAPIDLERNLWRCCEKVARRLREAGQAATGVTLKLKTAGFVLRTRSARLRAPSRLPDVLFAALRGPLAREADGTRFRLIGLSTHGLVPLDQADAADLADPDSLRRVARQDAIEALRERYGAAVIGRGRNLGP